MVQMGIALGCLDLGVPRVDQKAGITVRQVVDADILQVCFAPRGVP